MCQSQSSSSSHPSPCPLCVHRSHFPLCLCLCFCFANKIIYHFSRFHAYAFIYDIYFSLFHLLHSVWQSLGPFMSLQMTSSTSLKQPTLPFSPQGLCPCSECYIPSHLHSLLLNVCSFFRAQFRDSHPDNLFLISQSGLSASTTCLENILWHFSPTHVLSATSTCLHTPWSLSVHTCTHHTFAVTVLWFQCALRNGVLSSLRPCLSPPFHFWPKWSLLCDPTCANGNCIY